MDEKKRKSLADRVVAGLRDMTRKLRDGVPIECTTIRRIETPDGPAFIREYGVLNPPATPIPDPDDEKAGD